MITNYAPKLYKQFEKEYEKNGLSLASTEEKQLAKGGFLSRPTSPTQNSTDSRTTAFEMWSNFREARNRLKAEKDK